MNRVIRGALTAIGLCLLAGAVVLFAVRDQIWPPPAPVVAKAGPSSEKLAPAKAASAEEERPAVAPRSKIVSWAGLTVEPCVDDIRLDLMVRPVLGHLDQDLLAAVKDLKDASGLFPVAEDRVAFVPVSRKGASFREPYAVLPGSSGTRVEFAIEPVVLSWWPARQVFASALAEAVLLQEVPKYAEAPPWFRHGLALYLSEFGTIYSDRALVESSLPPPQMVRPLAEAGDLSWLDGYWAVKALSARAGDEAVKRWAQSMFEGRPFGEALRAATGETLAVFEEKYREWTLAQIRDRCANRQEIVDAVALLRLRKEAETIPALESFVKNRPLDLYAGNARYFLNYARFRNGDYEEAINGFTDLLVNAPATTSWQGKAHYFLGRSYQLAGYRPLAVKEYMLAALDPDSTLLVKLAKEHLAEVER